MPNVYKQLAQAQGTGAAASIYSPAAGENVIIREVRVVNTTGGALAFRLYHDEDGTTYDATTQILSLTSIPANWTFESKAHWCMNTDAGNLAWNAPSGLTITLYGVVIT